MHRLPKPFLLLPCLIAGLTGCLESRPRRPAEAVVLVTLDTTRADRLGCYGNTSIETPVLDGIARRGALLLDASAVAPVTLPSHASMMTGRYPAVHGVRNNGMYTLPDSERTLAEIFRERGYETAAFIGAFPLSSTFGIHQGFDVYDEFLRPPTESGGLAYSDYEERSAARVNEAALGWLASRKGGKFFMWVHYFDPHAPYAPPAPFRERYATAPYDGEIAFVDSNIGEIVDAVSRIADPSRTVLAVVGDHGESRGEHGEFFHGVFVYEATIRSPFLFEAEGRVRPGLRIEDPVSIVDLFPTLLTLAGIGEEASKGAPIQGVDLTPVLAGNGPAARPETSPILLESLLPRLEFGWSELHALRDGNWKYVQAPIPELYDLATDPPEVRNLLADGASPEIHAQAAGMKARLEATLKALPVPAEDGAGRREMDEETLEKLRALGYLQGPSAGSSLPPTGRDPKEMIRLYEGINRVGLLLRQADFDGAIAASRDLLSETPDNPRIQWWYGEALLVAGRHDELEEYLKPLLGEDPAYYWVPGLLGRSLESRGDVDGAVALYRQASRIDPDFAEHAMRVATLLMRSGRPAEALGEARAVLERRPDHRAALGLAAEATRRLGNPDEAAALWMKVLERRPRDPEALASLGRLRFDAQRFDEARHFFEMLGEAAPQSAEGPRFLGALAVLRGDPATAVPLLREASRLDPDHPITRYWLGIALIRTGDLAAAEEQIVPLVEKRPRSLEANRALGMLRQAQGRRDEAVAAFRRALAVRPGDALSRAALQELGAAR